MLFMTHGKCRLLYSHWAQGLCKSTSMHSSQLS